MKKTTLIATFVWGLAWTAQAQVGTKITSLDQLSNDKCYTILPEDNGRGTWLYDANDPSHLWSTGKKQVAVDPTSANQQFAFLKSESGKMYVYSVEGKRFLAYDKSTADGASVALVENILNTDVYATIVNSTSAQKADYPWVVSISGGHHIGISNGFTYGVISHYNSTNDGGNCISITEAGNFDNTEAMAKIQEAENKIPLIEEANAYLKVPANAVGGHSETLWNALYEACGSDGTAEIADINNPNFETALNNIKTGTPIEFSNDKVYKIQNYIASNGYLISREQTDNSQVFSSAKKGEQTEALPIIENSEKWQAYTDDAGNTLLYNQGTQKYVQFDATNDLWKLTEEAAYCNIQKNEAKGMGAYSIQDPNYTGQYQYMHVNVGQGDISGVKGWETAGDATNFYFIETDGTALDLAAVALEKVKSEAQKLIDSYSPEYSAYVGYYSSSSIAALQTALQAPDATVSSIQNAIDQTKASAKTIQADKYYRIQNTMAFDDGETKFIYESADGSNIAWGSGVESAAELWKLEATEEGTYYITSANTGKQIQLNPGMTDGRGYLTEQSTTPFTLESKDNSYTYGLVAYSQNDHATLVLQKEDKWGQTATSADLGGNFVGTYNEFSASRPTKWNIVETESIRFEISAAGYATAWFPFAVNIPSGVEVYYVNAVNNEKAFLKSVEGIIPAKSAVIIKGQPGTYTLEIANNQSAPIEGNYLVGLPIATNMDNMVNAYILGNKEGVTGFYQLNADDRTIAANKAYLQLPETAAGIKALVFDFGTTGIDETETDLETEIYYDLQGRRIEKPSKGIYVTKSGKKVLFN